MAGKRQIPETLFDGLGFRMTYEAKRVIYEAHTEHQHLVLFEHPFFGKILMLDGATQVTTADEFVYHEMMTHVPILGHGNATPDACIPVLREAFKAQRVDVNEILRGRVP